MAARKSVYDTPFQQILKCNVPEYQYLFRRGSTEVRGRHSNKCA
jgi:hypothetical protein